MHEGKTSNFSAILKERKQEQLDGCCQRAQNGKSNKKRYYSCVHELSSWFN